MDRTIILILSGFLLLGTARAELQLTPTLGNYELDGVKMQQLLFPDGEKMVTYMPPRGWDYSAGGNRLTLRPSSGSNAEAEIRVIKLAVPQTFDDATMKQLSDEVAATLPPSALKVRVVSQEKNPLMIERKETFLVQVHYENFGEAYARSVLFVNRKGQQLRCQLTCRLSVFPQMQRAFQSSQYSWQNL
jgi:hypothetical protein